MPDELLYGRSGYLFACLYADRVCKGTSLGVGKDIVRKVCETGIGDQERTCGALGLCVASELRQALRTSKGPSVLPGARASVMLPRACMLRSNSLVSPSFT